MKKTKLVITLVSLVFVLSASVFAGFETKRAYDDGFADVKDSSWYAQDVKIAYELGLVEGTGDNTFSPDEAVSVAQGIAYACRVHSEYNGKNIARAGGGKWYDEYVAYAENNGIMEKGQYDDLEREITRLETALLFYNALPKDAFKAKNDVVFIPDIPIDAVYYNKLLTLYNAGVVMGSDEYGVFNPQDSIKRSECASIITRLAVEDKRLTKTLSDFTSENAYVLCYNVGMNGSKEGINSGWKLDNRGGVAKDTLDVSNILGDVSEKYGTCFIREFNFIPAGKIMLEITFSALYDGSYLEYRDIEENTTYMLKIADGNWCLLMPDGSYKEICKTSADGNVNLRAQIDLDTGKSVTNINGLENVQGSLLSDNIMSFRIGIDEKGRGSMTVSRVNMVVNYGMYEDYDMFGLDSSYGWTRAENVQVKNEQLDFSIGESKGALYDTAAIKQFDAVDGKVCFETYFITRAGYDFFINVGNGAVIDVANKILSANGKQMYTIKQNMWYRLRAELDNVNKSMTVYLNGRVIGTAPIEKPSEVDFVGISSKGYLSLDNTKVYALYEYSDYVPVPKYKANMDDYIVGMNICSLWRNGTHSGWACISAYEEPTPVLGYYDEGLPESADWEIKYMVEHGVDFQAFCWYNDVSNGPVKDPRNGEQLHNGYMYAKYSDYMKYCILFEAANCAHFTSDQFRNYIIPYWFENYFLDPRYMTIDNQLVLPVFGAWTLTNKDYFGSSAGVKREFDYLEKVARDYGFDGVLILYNGTASKDYESMGFDGVYSYNWGTNGKSWRVNVEEIQKSANVGAPYTIPTISVGFDSIPWHGERYGNMPQDDFGKALLWVKDKYLPKFSSKDDWTDRLVWLSTWNEYGEGTYIMPAGLNGFGYLDEVRKCFTSYLQLTHEDIIPNAKQRERINHLYPQYATLLRRDGWFYYEFGDRDITKDPQNKLFINDIDVMENCDLKYRMPPEIKDGKPYFPFNLYTGLEHILGSVVSYRRDAGTLKIEAGGHVVIFEIGEDKYILDGKVKDLGYTVETFDNLPLIDFVLLAKDLGYKVSEKDGNVYIYTDTYESEWKKKIELKAGTWEFNNDFNDEGWTSTSMTIATQNGSAVFTSIGETKDPIARYKSGSFPEDFYTKRYKGVEIRCRFKYSGGIGNTSIYYITDFDGVWNEAKCLRLSHSTNDTGDEWVTLTYDLTEEINWVIAEKLTGLRFDPFNSTGSMEVDYIRFIEDEKYEYVDPEKAKINIVNGDAENDKLMLFYSANADISRVEDEEKEGNHYWYVKAKPGPNYTYFRYSTRFKPFTSYKIEYDIKLLENNVVDAKDVTKTAFHSNFRYADKGAYNHFDHVVRGYNVNRISQKDGWVHYTATFKTGKIDSYGGSEFTIYLDPVENIAFSFAVDNVVVTEIEEEKTDTKK